MATPFRDNGVLQQKTDYPALRQLGEEEWLVCSPETAPGFGRVAFYFARRLQQDALVPIGIMVRAVGGSNIESWLNQPPEAIGKHYTPDAPLQWLSIQDATGHWHWADGKIEGSKLIVSAKGVENPVAVRYAYTSQPLGHLLYNTDGMPVSPFTTCGYDEKSAPD